MPSLHETQALTLAALLDPGRADAAVRLLRRGPGLTPERRLQVYRNNLHQRATCFRIMSLSPNA